MAIEREILAKDQQYVPGILGGMGPASHLRFEELLLRQNYLRREGTSDQSHPVWVIINASSTPDRTQALLYGGETPIPHLKHYARIVENAGADGLFVICNTAHAFHREVQETLQIPWIHLMDITAERLVSDNPEISQVGILATDGTIASRLYHEAFESRGVNVISPTVGSEVQEQVMNAIYHKEYGIKSTGTFISGVAAKNLLEAAQWCHAHGAQAIITACTEISLVLHEDVFQEALIVDPLVIAADTALDLSYGVTNPQKLLKSY